MNSPDSILIEIVSAKLRPVLIVKGHKTPELVTFEQIVNERVELAKENEKLASESETLWYMTSKARRIRDTERFRRLRSHLYVRWCREYRPDLTPPEEYLPVLDEIEQIELRNIRAWLYHESVRQMNIGVITPGLDLVP